MTDPGTIWPEQEAVHAWFERHAHELKVNVTKERLRMQGELETSRAENTWLRDKWARAEEDAKSVAGHELGVWPIGAVAALHKLRAENERLKAELEIERAKNGWRPIETAPKDRPILTLNDRGVYQVQWMTPKDHEDCHFDWWWIDAMKAGMFPLRGSAPTHWRPVPDPPQEVSK